MQPAYMTYLYSHLGAHSVKGQTNPFILSLFKHTTYQPNSDKTPWCAACACTALEENGFTSPHRADAISFLTYGTACDLIPGCIVLLQFDNGKHHVTFCDHVIDKYLFCGIGGNQSESICLKNYNKRDVLACRWPVNNVKSVKTDLLSP